MKTSEAKPIPYCIWKEKGNIKLDNDETINKVMTTLKIKIDSGTNITVTQAHRTKLTLILRHIVTQHQNMVTYRPNVASKIINSESSINFKFLLYMISSKMKL